MTRILIIVMLGVAVLFLLQERQRDDRRDAAPPPQPQPKPQASPPGGPSGWVRDLIDLGRAGVDAYNSYKSGGQAQGRPLGS